MYRSGSVRPGGGGECADGRLLDDEALLVERAEDVAHDLVMVLGRRPCEQVVREPEPPQVVANDLVVAVGELTRRDSFLVRGHHDRRAVLVGAADHQHVVAPQPVVPGEDVRGDAEARHVADVSRAVRIRPCDRDQDLLR